MGIHSQINNRKRSASKITKGTRRRQPNENKTIVLEGTEYLSRDQLKKLAKNPTNNIRPSGKRRRKMMKRLGHSQREKNMMEVEIDVTPGPSGSGSKTKKAKAAKTDDSSKTEDNTEAMEEDTT